MPVLIWKVLLQYAIMAKFVQTFYNMEELKCAWTKDGEQFVEAIGIMKMPVLYAGSWDIHQMVCLYPT